MCLFDPVLAVLSLGSGRLSFRDLYADGGSGLGQVWRMIARTPFVPIIAEEGRVAVEAEQFLAVFSEFEQPLPSHADTYVDLGLFPRVFLKHVLEAGSRFQVVDSGASDTVCMHGRAGQIEKFLSMLLTGTAPFQSSVKPLRRFVC